MDPICIISKSLHRNSAKRRRFHGPHVQLPSSLQEEWGPVVCAVSCGNIVAFSTSARLHSLGSAAATKSADAFHVYVADLNIAWNPQLVKTSSSQVNILKWDQSGRYLLVADNAGNTEIWSTPTHLLSEWSRVAHLTIPDEPIRAAIFFHSGKKVLLQNKDAVLYGDKFVSSDMQPTARGFGGRPLEGFMVVGMTGLVQAYVMGGTKGKSTNLEVLNGMRMCYNFVDLAWSQNGDIKVLASTGNPTDPIVCCKLNVSKSDNLEMASTLDEYSLRCENLAGFFPEFTPDIRITDVKFNDTENPNGIYFTLKSSSGGSLQLWQLKEQQRNLHTLFGGSTRSSVSLQWQCVGVYNSPTQLAGMSPASSRWVGNTENGSAHLLVSDSEGQVTCIYRESLQKIGSFQIPDDSDNAAEESGSKSVAALALTATGNAAVIFNHCGSVYLCRLSPVMDPGGPFTVPYAVLSLEYCLYTSTDYWDILINLRPGMLDSICDRLTDNLNQQSPATQQLFQSRLLTVKMAIYRLVSGGNVKAAVQYTTQMLTSVYSSLRSLLRPSAELFNQDKTPADNLTTVLSSKALEGVVEVDKVILHLEPKEFTVDPLTLITEQHLIQWTATIALKLLTGLPEARQSSRGSLSDLLKDPKAVNMLRELLVLFRIWGLIRQTCLPSFCCMENIDVVGTLFRILTRILMTPEPDDSLLDECCQLSSQLVIPYWNFGLAARGLASPLLFTSQLPIQCEYGKSPETLMSLKSESASGHSGSEGRLVTDCVRHVHLGENHHNTKICTRCRGVSIIKGLTRSAAAKSWDIRWLTCCPCHGSWIRNESR